MIFPHFDTWRKWFYKRQKCYIFPQILNSLSKRVAATLVNGFKKYLQANITYFKWAGGRYYGAVYRPPAVEVIQ